MPAYASSPPAITQMKNAVVAALWISRMTRRRANWGPTRHAARVQPPEDRRGGGLGERHAEAGRPDDGHGLEHRGDARSEASRAPRRSATRAIADAARERDPEAARGGGAGGEERDDRYVRRASWDPTVSVLRSSQRSREDTAAMRRP